MFHGHNVYILTGARRRSLRAGPGLCWHPVTWPRASSGWRHRVHEGDTAPRVLRAGRVRRQRPHSWAMVFTSCWIIKNGAIQTKLLLANCTASVVYANVCLYLQWRVRRKTVRWPTSWRSRTSTLKTYVCTTCASKIMRLYCFNRSFSFEERYIINNEVRVFVYQWML